jgi:hypothetical protein
MVATKAALRVYSMAATRADLMAVLRVVLLAGKSDARWVDH